MSESPFSPCSQNSSFFHWDSESDNHDFQIQTQVQIETWQERVRHWCERACENMCCGCCCCEFE
jgi:hypothetical protein